MSDHIPSFIEMVSKFGHSRILGMPSNSIGKVHGHQVHGHQWPSKFPELPEMRQLYDDDDDDDMTILMCAQKLTDASISTAQNQKLKPEK